MKKRTKLLILSSLVVVLPALVGLMLWGRLPEQMPTHWNAAGQVDGYSSRAFAVLGMPAFLLALHLLCLMVTRLDPKAKGQSGKVITMVYWLCPAISLLTGAVIYMQALDVMVMGADRLMLLGLGLLFAVIGNYLPKCRRNYTIGIRVPWALDDEDNWDATHRFAGRVWLIGGAVVMVLALLPQPGLGLTITFPLMLVMALSGAVYSYLYYKKHQGR